MLRLVRLTFLLMLVTPVPLALAEDDNGLPGVDGPSERGTDLLQEAPTVPDDLTTGSIEGTGLPAPKPAFQLAEDLDGLFDQLKRTAESRRADRISKAIWRKWQESDSRTVDLLTHWARGAAQKKKFVVALDLLDQITVLRPDYAEGWNQRATLHFTMKNYSKSIVDIERTLALEPRHFGALAGLASIMQILDRKEDALRAWYRALEVYPAMSNAQEAVLKLEEDLAGRGI